MTMNQETKNYIINEYLKYGCIVHENTLINKKTKIDYTCKCGFVKSKLYTDFMRHKQCRTCLSKTIIETPAENDLIQTHNDGTIERYVPVAGGWISDKGNAKNYNGKQLTLCPTKFRYHMAGKHQYASNLVAKAFKIDDYDKLDDDSYCVTHLDGDKSNNKVENLKVIPVCDKPCINKSRQSDAFNIKKWWLPEKFNDVEKCIVPELPKHTIYKNGEIWNGSWFLSFSEENEGYYSMSINSKTYKVHKIVCYAFNPIEGKTCLDDYCDLQVNHKDGNKKNNNADNLEWVTISEIIQHSYDTGLNKKKRKVLQYDKDGNFLKAFESIAKASRETDDREFHISNSAKGRQISTAKYVWKYATHEEPLKYKI